MLGRLSKVMLKRASQHILQLGSTPKDPAPCQPAALIPCFKDTENRVPPMSTADPCSTAAAGSCAGDVARSPFETVQPLVRRVQIRDLLTSPVLAELMELRVPSSAQDASGNGAEGSGGAATGRPSPNWCAAAGP